MHCNHGAHAACRCVYVGSKPRVVQATKRYFAAMSRDLLAEAWSTLIEVKIEVSIATRNLARVEKVLTQIRDSREDPRLDEEDSKCAKRPKTGHLATANSAGSQWSDDFAETAKVDPEPKLDINEAPTLAMRGVKEECDSQAGADMAATLKVP